MAGKPQPPMPKAGRFLSPNRRPGVLFNHMIHPLIPLTIRGVIWYQGESGIHPYDKFLAALVDDWRTRWGRSDMPFCVGQLHDVGPEQTDPHEKEVWNRIREAQLRVSQTVDNVGMTVSIDLGIPNDTHYPNKKPAGQRMALWALVNVYGRSLEYSGPLYHSMAIEGSRIRLRMDHVGSGLVAKGGVLKGFAIAGEDRKFVWADAAVDGDTILVSSPQVPQPKAVRYGWGLNPPCTLYNQAGLPASPFRTDNW